MKITTAVGAYFVLANHAQIASGNGVIGDFVMLAVGMALIALGSER